MFFLNKKLRAINEEITFLEIAIDEVDIYDTSHQYADILKSDYTAKLFNLMTEQYEIKKKIVLRNTLVLWIALIIGLIIIYVL